MRFAILSLVAAGALAISAGSADAGPPRYYGGYNSGYRGGFNNFSRPAYNYNSGFGITIGGARGGFFNFNTGPSFVSPGFGRGGYNNFYRPSYGGYNYGYRGYGSPWRW